jgi:hypothetical protein
MLMEDMTSHMKYSLRYRYAQFVFKVSDILFQLKAIRSEHRIHHVSNGWLEKYASDVR